MFYKKNYFLNLFIILFCNEVRFYKNNEKNVLFYKRLLKKILLKIIILKKNIIKNIIKNYYVKQ